MRQLHGVQGRFEVATRVAKQLHNWKNYAALTK